MALRFHSKERRKSLYDPSFELSRTHQFDYDATGLVTATSFPDRTKPITFAVTTKVTAGSPTGIILEFGSAIVGAAIWYAVADGKIYAAAGNAGATTGVEALWINGDITFIDNDTTWFDGDGGGGITLAGEAPPLSQITRIVFSVIPGSGKGRLWVNGKLVAAGDGGLMASGWADTGNGAIGDVEGIVTTRVSVADRVALANAVILSPVNVFQNQRPRQFFEVA